MGQNNYSIRIELGLFFVSINVIDLTRQITLLCFIFLLILVRKLKIFYALSRWTFLGAAPLLPFNKFSSNGIKNRTTLFSNYFPFLKTCLFRGSLSMNLHHILHNEI